MPVLLAACRRGGCDGAVAPVPVPAADANAFEVVELGKGSECVLEANNPPPPPGAGPEPYGFEDAAEKDPWRGKGGAMGPLLPAPTRIEEDEAMGLIAPPVPSPNPFAPPFEFAVIMSAPAVPVPADGATATPSSYTAV